MLKFQEAFKWSFFYYLKSRIAQRKDRTRIEAQALPLRSSGSASKACALATVALSFSGIRQHSPYRIAVRVK